MIVVGFFSRLFGDKAKGTSGKTAGKEEVEEKLTVNDFDLLKIVGKGAFGKVYINFSKNQEFHRELSNFLE